MAFAIRKMCISVLAKKHVPAVVVSITSQTSSSSKSLPIEQKNIKPNPANINISKAMKAYKERAEQEERFFAEKITEYEIGKRHLANIMGMNPETFTQDDVDEAIEYLLPSALFLKVSRPLMKHPTELFPKRKEAEFDETGRPFHTLFYTGRPVYHDLLQNIAVKAQTLDKKLYRQDENKSFSNKFQYVLEEKALDLGSTKWISKQVLEKKILEFLTDKMYNFFIVSMNRLVAHPLSYLERKFVMDFRQDVSSLFQTSELPKLMYTDLGVPYMTCTGTRRKCTSEVTVFSQGSGKFTINGEDILYFANPQEREQVMFPLQFSKMLNRVDVVATAEGPANSKSGQAGAVRFALAMALRAFVDETMVEKMRIAGLLTRDRRKRERKKPGRRRARAKYTWKKR